MLIDRPDNQCPAPTAIMLGLKSYMSCIAAQTSKRPSPPSIGIIMPTAFNLCSHNSTSGQVYLDYVLQTYRHIIAFAFGISVPPVLSNLTAQTFRHIVRRDPNFPLRRTVRLHSFVAAHQFALALHLEVMMSLQWPPIGLILCF